MNTNRISYIILNERHFNEMREIQDKIKNSQYRFKGKLVSEYKFPEDFVFDYEYSCGPIHYETVEKTLDQYIKIHLSAVCWIKLCAYIKGSQRAYESFMVNGYIPPDIIQKVEESERYHIEQVRNWKEMSDSEKQKAINILVSSIPGIVCVRK